MARVRSVNYMVLNLTPLLALSVWPVVSPFNSVEWKQNEWRAAKTNSRWPCEGVHYERVDYIFENLKLTKQVSFPMFHQELIYLWNGFKVLGHRPDLVEPLMNLVENSLHKLHKAKGEDYFNVMSVHREERHKKFWLFTSLLHDKSYIRNC